MARVGLPATTDLPVPQLEGLDWSSSWALRYDKKADVLYVHTSVPRAAISVDLEGEMWLRMDPATGEVYGFEFEDFEKVFLAAHPDLASAWREAKPALTGQLELTNWLNILFEFIRQHFAGRHPQQLSLSPQP
jgi:uncharacterized protein YuzE